MGISESRLTNRTEVFYNRQNLLISLRENLEWDNVMVKRIILVVVSVFVAFGLSACREVDGTGDVKPKQKVEIVQNLDLSEVSVLSEVYVYSAEYWEGETETILDVFLDGVYDKEENDTDGMVYSYKPATNKEKFVYIMDGRKSLSADAGLTYGYVEYMYFDELFPEYAKLDKEYFTSRKFYSQNLNKEEEAFVTAKEEIEDYLEKIHMEHYAIHDAAMLQGEGTKEQGASY